MFRGTLFGNRGLQKFLLRSKAGGRNWALVRQCCAVHPCKCQQKLQTVRWCEVVWLSWAPWDWPDLYSCVCDAYLFAAESPLPKIINNSYVAVYEFLCLLFTIHPNYLTLTCGANGEYTLLLLQLKESLLIAN